MCKPEWMFLIFKKNFWIRRKELKKIHFNITNLIKLKLLHQFLGKWLL